MPEVTLRKRKPEHQNRVSKLIRRTGENHHTDPKKKSIKGEALITRRESGERKQTTGKRRPNLPNSDTRRLEAQISSIFRKETTKISASQQEDGTHTMVKEKLKNQGKPLKLREGSSEARQQRWWGTTTRPCVRACARE
jgi:hypothetical protein